MVTIKPRFASIKLRLYFQALLITAFAASIGSLAMIEEDYLFDCDLCFPYELTSKLKNV